MLSGVLIFQPVEMLAAAGWLLTCWHPTRTFVGAEKVDEGGAGHCEQIRKDVCGNGGARPMRGRRPRRSGHEAPRTRLPRRGLGLAAWHEDWELSLYVDDQLDNPDELPSLWGSMAVLSDWLNPSTDRA